MAKAPRVKIGDKNYVLPSETVSLFNFPTILIHIKILYSQATFDDAQKMCRDRNMNLVSFEKLAESDLVSDFISGLGRKINYVWSIENY